MVLLAGIELAGAEPRKLRARAEGGSVGPGRGQVPPPGSKRSAPRWWRGEDLGSNPDCKH